MRDLIGKKFGKLTVTEYGGKNHRGNHTWKCRCDCGKDKLIQEWYLINRIKSCGCGRGQLELIGKRFGKLVVVSFNKINGRHSNWNCKCDCGNECTRNGSALIYRQTNSCGCYKNFTGKLHKSFKGYEGLSRTFFNKIRYGANRSRKIKFDLTIEYLWDLYLKQNKKCALTKIDLWFTTQHKKSDGNISLDRIDSSKGYVEGNVQWVHKDINWMKYKFSQDYFIKLCKMVVSANA